MTFQWKKSQPTIEKEISLFSAFDPVVLTWDSTVEVFKSQSTKVACGTYNDCQLVVNGELYTTKPIVINQDIRVVHIQLENTRAIEERHPHGSDWRHDLAYQDRKVKDNPVAPRSHQEGRFKESSVDNPEPYSNYPLEWTSNNTARSDVQRQSGAQQHISQGSQFSGIRDHCRRTDDTVAMEYNSPSPTSQRARIAGSNRPSMLESSSRAVAGAGGEYGSNSQDMYAGMKNQQILSQQSSGIPSVHDARVDEMKEMHSFYSTSVHDRQPNDGYLSWQQGSAMDAQIEHTRYLSEQKHPAGTSAQQSNPSRADLSSLTPSHQQFELPQGNSVRQSGHHLSNSDTRIEMLQAERNRSQHALKVLTAQLEEYQKHEKELQHSITSMKQLLAGKDASERQLAKQISVLQDENQQLKEEVDRQDRGLKQLVAGMESQVAEEKEKSSEMLRKIQEKLENANKYNSHLKGALEDSQKTLSQEKTATGKLNQISVQMKDRIRRLEEENKRLQQRASECEGVLVAMESMKSNMEGLQLSKDALQAQLDELEADRAEVVKANQRAEQELRKSKEKRDNDIKQRDREYDSIQQQNSKLKTQLVSLTSLKEEAEGIVESLQSEIAELKANLQEWQKKSQQFADEKEVLTARIQAKESDKTELLKKNDALMKERDKVFAQCQTFQRAVEEAEKSRDEAINQFYDEQTMVKALEERMNSMGKELKSKAEKAEKADEAVQRANLELEKHRGNVKTMEGHLKKSVEDGDKYRQQMQQLEESLEESKKSESDLIERLKREQEHHEHKLKKQLREIASKGEQIQGLQSQLDAKCQALQETNEMLQRKEAELSDIAAKQQEDLQVKQKEIEALESSLKQVKNELAQSQAAYRQTHGAMKEQRKEMMTLKQGRQSPSPHMNGKNSAVVPDKQLAPSGRRETNATSVENECRDPEHLLHLHAQHAERVQAAGMAQRVPNDVNDQSVGSVTNQQRNTMSSLSKQANSHTGHRGMAATSKDGTVHSGSAEAVDKLHYGPANNRQGHEGSIPGYTHSEGRANQGQLTPVVQKLLAGDGETDV